jgi:tRNA(Ile2) C34 agmatinyltransferase TiaS
MPAKFREMRCPDCGKKLKPKGDGKYVCGNPKCSVISVWSGHGYMGSDRVLRDAVMANDKKEEILKVAGR